MHTPRGDGGSPHIYRRINEGGNGYTFSNTSIPKTPSTRICPVERIIADVGIKIEVILCAEVTGL